MLARKAPGMSVRQRLSPHSVEFVILSFEGPDLYSLVGGLGVRVSELSAQLAELGFNVRLFFVGDPALEHCDTLYDGRLTYHRWSQWLSAGHPNGVYDGEMQKVTDFNASIPEFLVEEVIRPNAEAGKTTVVMAEDWQTVGAVIGLSKRVYSAGLSRRTMVLWNANNVFGFEGIDWQALRQACAITTVSKYMKQLMNVRVGVNPLVIPNGIPERWFEPVPRAWSEKVRSALPGLLLAKVGRYHPDKRWLMAVESVGELKRLGLRPRLVVRGGQERHRIDVLEKAWQQGLVWAEIHLERPTPNRILKELKRHKDADILELCFFVPEDVLRGFYWAADAVLANSKHEPFGLVGLEVMACGGVVFTGCSGEDYAQSFVNSVVIDSDDPREITVYARDLQNDARLPKAIRKRARVTCRNFLWETVCHELFRKIEFVAWIRGVDLE